MFFVFCSTLDSHYLYKKAMTGNTFYFGLISWLILSGCSDKVKVTVDNPLKETLLIKVDDENFTYLNELLDHTNPKNNFVRGLIASNFSERFKS